MAPVFHNNCLPLLDSLKLFVCLTAFPEFVSPDPILLKIHCYCSCVSTSRAAPFATKNAVTSRIVDGQPYMNFSSLASETDNQSSLYIRNALLLLGLCGQKRRPDLQVANFVTRPIEYTISSTTDELTCEFVWTIFKFVTNKKKKRSVYIVPSFCS